MMIALMAVYLVLLFVLVHFGIVTFNLFWKCSPFIVLLLLNLLLLAGGTIPRGGSLAIEPVGEGDAIGFKVTASGLNARIPPAVPALVSGDTGGNAVDAHAIQPFFTGLLARTCGMGITLAPEGEAIVLTAR